MQTQVIFTVCAIYLKHSVFVVIGRRRRYFSGFDHLARWERVGVVVVGQLVPQILVLRRLHPALHLLILGQQYTVTSIELFEQFFVADPACQLHADDQPIFRSHSLTRQLFLAWK